MKTPQRLLGIDLWRGIAVLGVVILHSDGGVEETSWIWELIRQLFAFAVPFFLATSFYFAIAKSQQGKLVFYSRLKRLLYPYLVWTLIYLIYKIAKYILDGEAARVTTLFKDPFALIFCGGAAFHLYFLPLLLWGICLIKLLEFSNLGKANLKTLAWCLIISLVISNWIVISGNGFQLSSATAFTNWKYLNTQPILRLVLLLIAWTFWCLPYIFVGKIAYHQRISYLIDQLSKRSHSYMIYFLAIGFLILAWFDFWWNPVPLSEVIRGYIALFMGIWFSQGIKPQKWLLSLGSCSFGIYLIHLIFIESFYIIGNRFNAKLFQQPSILLLISIAVSGFFLSWMATSLMLKLPKNTRLIFGF